MLTFRVGLITLEESEMDEYSEIEQWLYDTGIAMPGDVRRYARMIESAGWFKALTRTPRDRSVNPYCAECWEGEYHKPHCSFA